MKIRVEGKVKDIVLDIEESERTGEPLSPEAQAYLDSIRSRHSNTSVQDATNKPIKSSTTPAHDSSKSLLSQFANYINHGRCKYALTSDNIFTGSLKMLQSFKKSWEKHHPDTEVIISSQYISGEYKPVVKNVIYKGGK